MLIVAVQDMGIALAESQRMGIALPGLALANQLYVRRSFFVFVV
jgi:hypothetical protein